MTCEKSVSECCMCLVCVCVCVCGWVCVGVCVCVCESFYWVVFLKCQVCGQGLECVCVCVNRIVGTGFGAKWQFVCLCGCVDVCVCVCVYITCSQPVDDCLSRQSDIYRFGHLQFFKINCVDNEILYIFVISTCSFLNKLFRQWNIIYFCHFYFVNLTYFRLLCVCVCVCVILSVFIIWQISILSVYLIYSVFFNYSPKLIWTRCVDMARNIYLSLVCEK